MQRMSSMFCSVFSILCFLLSLCLIVFFFIGFLALSVSLAYVQHEIVWRTSRKDTSVRPRSRYDVNIKMDLGEMALSRNSKF